MSGLKLTSSLLAAATHLAAISALILAVGEPAQGEPMFMGLGDLPGGTVYSYPVGISADGSTVVGYSYSASGTEAFRWTSGGGMVGLGDLPGGDFSSSANGASADGSVVVGGSSGDPVTGTFRWTSGGGMVGLGGLPGGYPGGAASSVSADGSTVVGSGFNSTNDSEAFIWTSGGGMVGLGELPGGLGGSHGVGVSADGSTIAGWSYGGSGLEPFLWTSTGGMVSLGHIPGTWGTDASDISADGSTVVGSYNCPDDPRAYRWTNTGGFESLGTFLGENMSLARGVSGDGSVVVGYGWGASSGMEAFIWDATNGMRELDVVLTNLGLGPDLAGWILRSAEDISNDGRVIVGGGLNPNGDREAWIAVLDEPVPSVPSLSPAGTVLLGGLVSAIAAGGLAAQRRRGAG